MKYTYDISNDSVIRKSFPLKVKFSNNTVYDRIESQAFITDLKSYNEIKRKLYDSGCSYNMFNSHQDFDTLTLGGREPIEIADGSFIHSTGRGESSIYGKALLVPDLSIGLISTPQDDLAGNFTLYGDGKVLVLDERPIITGNIIRSGTLVNDQRYLSDLIVSDIADYTNTNFIYPTDQRVFRSNLDSNISEDKWKFIHGITGHTSLNNINNMITNTSLLGLPKKPIRIFNVECKACILAKLKKLKRPTNMHNRPLPNIDPPKTYTLFEVIGCDIVDCGKDNLSINKNRYTTVFIDFYSDCTYVYFHNTIDEFLNKCLKPFYYDIINPARSKVDSFYYLQSDDAPIYTTDEVKEFLGERGCLNRQSAPYHAEQNRRIEKAIEQLLLSSTSSMLHSACPPSLWEHAMEYACDARNDRLTSRHPSITPTELSTGIKPTLVGRYPFYWSAYFVLQDKKHFHPRSQQCYILRQQPGFKRCYLIYTPHSPSRIYVRYDVRPSIFEKPQEDPNQPQLQPLSLEDMGTTSSTPPTSDHPIFTQSDDISSDEDSASETSNRGIKRKERKERKKQLLTDIRTRQSLQRQASIRKLTKDLGPYWTKPPQLPTPDDDLREVVGSQKRRIHNKRSIKLNNKYNNINTSPIIGRRPTRHERMAIAQASNASSDMPPTPSSVEEALSGPDAKHWIKAINDEKLAIINHSTYENAPSYKGKTVKSKIAFRVTREADGTFKYKARLVAKGFTERKGYDYFHTYAPTVLTKSVHLLLHLAATNDWEIRNLDVGGAYLEADIDTELYMQIPTEFSIDGSTTTVKLKKSIYGLKQSGELWNSHIHKIFLSLGFTRSVDDPCVYARIIGDQRTYLCLYVDDILVIGSDLSIINIFESELSNLVQKLKIMGDTVKYVGIDIIRNRATRKIYLSQQQFISDIVESEGLSNTKIIKNTPASVSRNLYISPRGGNTPIRSLVGKLRYAVDNTRPDSLFITSQLGSAAADPGDNHLLASNHLVTYLNSTRNLSLVLGGTDPIILECFTDSSYIEVADSKSQLAYCMRLGATSGMFLSRSLRDDHVSLSSAESELFAVKESIQDIVWARNLLEFLGFEQLLPTPIYEDNQAVLFLTDIIKVHPRTRHINKIINFVREFISLNVISLIKVSSALNIADILTKYLEKGQFLFLRNLLLGH